MGWNGQKTISSYCPFKPYVLVDHLTHLYGPALIIGESLVEGAYNNQAFNPEVRKYKIPFTELVYVCTIRGSCGRLTMISMSNIFIYNFFEVLKTCTKSSWLLQQCNAFFSFYKAVHCFRVRS
jgi:hypothetical protein